MKYLCLDFEGVLIPEIWQYVAEATNSKDLMLTFLNWARSNFQVTIVSDTFYELAWPLVEKLNFPSIICHHLNIEEDKIMGYKLRQKNNKQKVIEAFKSLNYEVFAAGDSYNDINMLNEADLGIFFQAPKHIKQEYPNLLTADSHEELKTILINKI